MPLRVLITSIGSASGMNVIKCLRKQQDLPVYLVGVDADCYATGLQFTDSSYILPKFTEEGYLEKLLEIARAEDIRYLIPTFSAEIEFFSRNKEIFLQNKIQMLIPDYESVKKCNDKVEFSSFVQNFNIRTPKILEKESLLSGESIAQFPVFVKPIVGSSSVGATIIRSKEELQIALSQRQDRIIQEHILGSEVTVDVFANKNFEALAVCPRLRLSVKNGQSVKGKTIEPSPFEQIVKTLCKELKLVGASNFQFILKNNQPVLIEINPRFAGGGLMLTAEAGVNIPLLVIKELLGKPISAQECFPKKNILMSRYWEEVFWSEEE